MDSLSRSLLFFFDLRRPHKKREFMFSFLNGHHSHSTFFLASIRERENSRVTFSIISYAHLKLGCWRHFAFDLFVIGLKTQREGERNDAEHNVEFYGGLGSDVLDAKDSWSDH
jgi:hypothetical protein